MVKSLDRKLLRDLGALRAQSATLALLVACGVSLLVSAWSAYRSLQSARDSYYNENAFADVFAELKRAPLDVADRLKKVPGTQIVEPRILAEGLVDVADQDEPAVGHFISLPTEARAGLNRIYLRSGRLPEEGRDPIEALVHEGFAKAHDLKPGSFIEVLIEEQRKKVRVSGIGLSPEFVYALSPIAPLPDDKHFGVFWMPPRTLEELRGMSGAFNSVVLKLAPGASQDDVIRRIDQILKPYGSLGAYGRDRQVSNMFVEDEIVQQRVSAIFNPLVFLSVAAFLIHVIFSRLILTQRSQIATLKAVGYANREVSAHYAKLVTVMMTLGTLPGIALGAVLGRMLASSYQDFFRFPSLDFSMNPSSVVVGIAGGILPGLIGALATIRSTYRMPAAEAMSPPAPPSFHESLLERTGLQERLRVPSRMIARNLLLRPTRLAMTVLGMSLALGVIVLSGFWQDTIRFLMDTHFQMLQREDMSATFLHPLPASALLQITRMKGVVAVEGYRTVSVRFRHQNLQRDATLYGWPEDASMRQRLGPRLEKLRVPKDGLLLSRFFEKKLALRRGDLVEVEILEGEPKTVQVPVVDFSDDLVGYSGTMDLKSLWRLLDEESGYNLVTIKTDPRSMSRLYVALKQQPEVASLNVKAVLYHGFQETVGKIIHATSLILATFALAIAVGVIYNSVRVSFSERSWEMASLRILGFTRLEVQSHLFGEVAIQVLASLIPGCLAGRFLSFLSSKAIHTETYAFPIIINASTYARAIAVILIALFASGFVVSGMVKRLSLADALKARD